MTDDEAKFGCFVFLPVLLVLLTVAYGLVILVFRYAYGIELPNPANLLPDSWRTVP